MQAQRVPSFQIVLTLFCSFDRCEDGRTVYLKDGFWGGLNKRGDLVAFFVHSSTANVQARLDCPDVYLIQITLTASALITVKDGCVESTVDTSVGLR